MMTFLLWYLDISILRNEHFRNIDERKTKKGKIVKINVMWYKSQLEEANPTPFLEEDRSPTLLRAECQAKPMQFVSA